MRGRLRARLICPGLRGLPYRGRCFYFRVAGDSLIVVRVLSCKQDVSNEEFPEEYMGD